MKSSNLDLHINTIDEFHNNLMMYYDLVKEKQKQNKDLGVGGVVNIRRLILPEITLPEEFIEDRTILRDKENGKPRNWGTK